MMLHPGAPLGALAALAGAVLIYLTRQGTLGGAAAGLLVALVIVAGFGVPGFVPLGIFVLGSGLLTRMGSRRKERTGAAEPNRGRRDERHVAAKLALPALAGAIALLGPGPTPTLALVTTAALAAAFADTAATEAGPLTGGHAYGVRGMRLVALRHGAPGGMSSGGFFAAAAAAILVAFGAWLAKLLDSPLEAGVAAGAGFLASALESLFAATSWGTRAGHFGRNVALTVASALLALSARALGWVAS